MPDLRAAALVFLVIAIAIGVVALVGGALNRPDCPAGQTWVCRTTVFEKVTTTRCACAPLP